MAVISDVPVTVDVQPEREGCGGPAKKLPGDLAMWFFILAELTVFAIFFFGYCWMYYANTELYVAGQATLHPIAGLINTLALITSSYLVAMAMIAAKEGRAIKIYLWFISISKVPETFTNITNDCRWKRVVNIIDHKYFRLTTALTSSQLVPANKSTVVVVRKGYCSNPSG